MQQYLFRGWRSKRELAGGGILLKGIHMLDLMRLFSGDFIQIKSFVSNKYWGHDVEDNAYAIKRYQRKSNAKFQRYSMAT